MKRILLFIFSYLSFIISSFGQVSDCDFLELDTFHLKNTASINAFETRIDEVKIGLSSDALIKYHKRGLKAAQAIQNDTIARIFADNILRMYLSENDLKNMEKYAKIALDHTKKTGKKRLIAYQYLTLATSYLGTDEIDKAIEYFLKVVEISQNHQAAKQYEYSAYMSLGFAFYQLGEIEESVSYLKLAEKYFFKNGDDYKDLYLAYIYSGMAGNFLELDHKDSSEFYINQTIHALQKVELDTTLDYLHVQSASSDIYFDIIEYYLLDNRLFEANTYYKKIKDFQILDQERKYIVDLQFSLKRNEIEKMKKLIDNPPEALLLIYELEYLDLVSKYYEKVGNDKKSLSFFKQKNDKKIEQLKTRQVKFSSFTKEKIKSINQKGKIEKLIQEKTLQRKLTNGLTIAAIAMVLSILLLVFAFYQVKLKNKLLNKSIEYEKTIKLQSQKLQKSELQKNKLFTNIAHEFQTPLNIIQGLSKYIATSHQLTDNGYEALQILNKNSKSLSKATQQILTINSPNQKKEPSKKVWFSLSQLFEYILPEFRFLAKERYILLNSKEVEDSSINIYSDLNKIITVLKNLLSNAIKYTAKEGTIFIKCAAHPSYAEIIIEDNGKGISPEELPYIFDRFYQAGKDAEGGFGLGLAICQEYIKSLNGKIKVSSTLGEGSSFSIQIPKINSKEYPSPIELYDFPKNDIPKPKSLNEPSKIPIGAKPQLLIVEDNIDFCTYLKNILQNDYQLTFMHNGLKAIVHLKNHVPALIITDWMMPDLDGLALIKKLKTSEEYNQIPILMLTARSLASDKIKALHAGVDDYLIKPIGDDLLKNRIAHFLKNENQLQRVKPIFASTISNHEGLELSKSDKDWLFKVEEIIFPLIQNFDLNLEQVAKLNNTNVTQLNRKLKSITGLTAKKYIQELRYWEARRMLETKEHESVKAICLSVGFKDQKNFSRKFKERFGSYPSEYLQAK